MIFCSWYLVPEVMGEIMVEGMVLITPVPIMVLAHLMEALGTEGIIVWDMPLDPRLGDLREA